MNLPASEPGPAETGTDSFLSAFQSVAQGAHADAVARGFWEGERNQGELIALMHSELSEALEALRHGNPPDKHLPTFSGVEVELADCLIRIMDAAAGHGWRVGEALIAKLEYNRSRPHKHGKSF